MDSKIYTVTLPDIGEGVVEGEVIEWRKQVGEPVAQDEPVVLVMTDKATVELPSPHPGKLAKQYYREGEVAIKGKPLYDIELESPQKVSDKPVEKPSPPESIKMPPQAHKVLATPKTRGLAKELGVDISQIAGTGTYGQVTPEDLKRTTMPGDVEKPLVGIRNLMAKKMSESKRLIPHFSYFEQLDATRLVQMRHHFKMEAVKEGVHVTFLPFIIKALSLSLKRFPEVNSSLDTAKNSLILHRQHNMGIAMSSPLGLIVPVLKGVQDLTLEQIIKASEELKKRATTNKLQPQDMKEGTISISNFGVLSGGGLWATPIINYPEVAILGYAKIQKQPVVRNGQVVARDVLNLSWSFDHRIIDGDMAAHFSHYFATLLQNPAALL